ncbi:MAG TPA: glycosyltransferase family 4 protein [Geobacterales bacterium]|nr:glycosyltransferase family 4 protein [Geobacterales bacterium]
MKILHLTWEYPPRIVGGLARHVYYLSKELSKLGNEVLVITLEFPNVVIEEYKDNLHIYRVKVELASYDFLTWCYAFNHFFEKKIGMVAKEVDLIHAHDWLVAISAISAKYLLGKPLVSTIHSLEIGRVGSLSNPLSVVIDNIEWWLTYESKNVITTSEFMKRQLIEHFKLPGEKITVISNGIEFREFDYMINKAEIRAMHGLPIENKLVGFIGRITEQKGVRYFIEAVPKILNKYGNVNFVVVGDGWQIDEMKELAKKLGIDWAVKFMGYLPDESLKNILKALDVLVIPSVYEPFGIIALEGMSAGVPLVASSVGGLDEILENEVDGLKVPPRNPDAIADAVFKLLIDESLRNRLVENARRKAIKFSWEEIAKRTMDVYEKVKNV